MAKEVVARVDEIAPGNNKTFTVRGREIVVFNVKGEFHAFLNKCPHEGARLCDGILVSLVESSQPGEYSMSRKGEFLRCPWHGWEFDLRTGQSWCAPERYNALQYPTSVAAGSDPVMGPYVAERYEAYEQDEFVVVEI